ncbi:hypothetical protein PYW08_009178 [Mythimna loreyi]|uniref:Uncharacterized protein n=2 Tax=Mythimna loreyi TaxID=667449 RepID=A0ACC2QAC6_9NEOP|nr:hypothetical protein PYW08_009151 [Mythimna loreyi]KAJ8710663.1 hypothetical protein PYW08_009178 [Mythimna loreyi]
MPTTTPDSDSDTDDEDTTDDTLGEQGVSVTITDPSSAELIPRYDDLLQKVRKVVQLFKRSPTKYDIYLQKYVKEDTESKEISRRFKSS